MSYDAEDRAERRWEAEQEADRVARHAPMVSIAGEHRSGEALAMSGEQLEDFKAAMATIERLGADDGADAA